MPHAVEYRPLANHLASLSLDASRDEFLACLESFRQCEPAFWAGLLAEMRELYPQADWWVCVAHLCGLLRAQNERFVEAIFLEWVLEDR